MTQKCILEFAKKESFNFDDLIKLVRILRDKEHGCSWDMEQTHDSITHNLIEESYEVLDAIDAGDSDMLKEELGDLLLQVALHTEMESEQAVFGIDDVCDGICKKLIYRHPHVFADTQVSGTDDVLKNWEELKKAEKGQNNIADSFEGIARSLPALMYAKKVQKTAKSTGYDFKDAEQALEKLQEELAELRKALQNGERPDEELGDMLFSAVNVSRLLKTDPELCLMEACNKFTRRVVKAHELASAQGVSLDSLTEHQLEQLWQTAKKVTE